MKLMLHNRSLAKVRNIVQSVIIRQKNDRSVFTSSGFDIANCDLLEALKTNDFIGAAHRVMQETERCIHKDTASQKRYT